MYDFDSIHLSTSVGDAVEALCADPESILIAAGTDVLIQIREGRYAGCSLVSIQNLRSELKGISVSDDGTIEIGALSTFREINENKLIKKYLAALAEAAEAPGGPQLRAVATIGGNVCNGITSADTASTLIAYDAVLCLRGPKGQRSVPINEWYTGPGHTQREHEEVLTKIRILRSHYEGYFGSYMKYGKRDALEIATLGVSGLVKLAEDKKHIKAVRLAYGVAGPIPMRAYKTEEKLCGMELLEAVEQVGEFALEELRPRTSWRASKEFRQQLIKVLSARVIKKAVLKGGAVL